jgi:hypothetical protein
MKSFDERFADRVREVFDAYTEPVDPSALAALRRKMQGSRAWIPLFATPWRLAAAASLIMVATATLWIVRPWEPAPPAEVVSADKLSEAVPRSDDLPAAIGILNDEHAGDTGADPVPGQDGEYGPETLAMRSGETDQEAGSVPPVSENELPDSQMKVLPDSLTVLPDINGSARATEGDTYPDLLPRPVRPLPVLTLAGLVPADEAAASAIDDIGSAADPLPANLLQQDRRSERGLGISAGSMVTYAGSQFAGGVGFFAGAVHDWPLSESLSLTSGGLLAWNRFDYEPTGAGVAERAILAELFSTSGTAREMDVDLNYDSRRQYSWVAVDIPVNLKWDVGGNSRGRYNLTVGLSSLVYLSQSFTEEGLIYSGRAIRNDNSGYFDLQLESTRFTERGDEPAFSRFDFARLMNIAIGYSLRNRGNPISFELYLKYPLGNLTSREISFGMGGVSMRYALGN